MKLFADRRRLSLWLTMSVVVVAVVVWQHHYANCYRPERVMDLPANTVVVKVENGELFTWTRESPAYDPNQIVVKFITRPGSNRKIPVMSGPPTDKGTLPSAPEAMTLAQDGSVRDTNPDIKHLFAGPVGGGKRREVGLDTVEAADPRSLWKTDIGIVQAFLRQPPHPPLRSIGGGGYSGSAPPPPPPKLPFHIEVPHSKADPVTLVLRKVTLDGSTFTDLRTLSAGKMQLSPYFDYHSSVAIVGGWVYWIEHVPGEMKYRVSADHQWKLLSHSPHCTVMAVPFAGGVPRKLMGGLWEDTQLIPVTNGVICQTIDRQAEVYTPEGYTHYLTFVSPYETPRKLLAGHSAQQMVALTGVLYWIESIPVNGSTPQLSKDRLMQSREDGANMLELTIPSTYKSGSNIHGLVVHNDKLYVTVSAAGRPTTGGIDIFRSVLYRVDPGTIPKFEKVLEEPDRAGWSCFDGDFFYCTATETRENMRDFSVEGLRGKEVEVLYRFPLPK